MFVRSTFEQTPPSSGSGRCWRRCHGRSPAIDLPRAADREREIEHARNEIARRRRRDRERLADFRGLITSPHDLGSGPLVLPAPGRLALSHDAGLAAGQVTVAVGAHRSFTHPAMAPDVVYRGEFGEEGMSVTAFGAPSGTLSLYLVDPLNGTYARIAALLV